MGPACRAMRPGMRGMAEESAASYRPCCLSHCCRGRGTAPNCGKGRKKDKGEKPPACPGVSVLGTARGQYGRTLWHQRAHVTAELRRDCQTKPGAFTNFQMNEGDSLCTCTINPRHYSQLHGTRTQCMFTDHIRISTCIALSDKLGT